MDMHEYNSRVKERNRIDSEYNNPKWTAITNAYIAIDLHKDQFCRMVDAIGWEQITNKSDYWQYVNTAKEVKRHQDEQLRRAARLKEIDAAVLDLQIKIRQLQDEAYELMPSDGE